MNVSTDGTVLLNPRRHGDGIKGLHTKVAQVVATEFGLPLCRLSGVTTTDTSRSAEHLCDGGFVRVGSQRQGRAERRANHPPTDSSNGLAPRDGVHADQVFFLDGQRSHRLPTRRIRRIRATARTPPGSRCPRRSYYRTPKIHLGSGCVSGTTVLLLRVRRSHQRSGRRY